MIPVLLQSRAPNAPGDTSLGPVLLWLGVLVVVTLAGGALLMWYRRRVLSQPAAEDAGSFMDELRRARDAGEMSAVEFEAAKKQMVARIRGNSAASTPQRGARGAARYGFHEGAAPHDARRTMNHGGPQEPPAAL